MIDNSTIDATYCSDYAIILFFYIGSPPLPLYPPPSELEAQWKTAIVHRITIDNLATAP